MALDPKLAAWLGVAPDATSFTAKLAAPVEVGDQTYTEITVREPTLADLEEVTRKGGIAQDIAMISLAGKAPERVAKALPASEYRKAMAFLNVFVSAQPTSSDS